VETSGFLFPLILDLNLESSQGFLPSLSSGQAPLSGVRNDNVERDVPSNVIASPFGFALHSLWSGTSPHKLRGTSPHKLRGTSPH